MSALDTEFEQAKSAVEVKLEGSGQGTKKALRGLFSFEPLYACQGEMRD